MTEPEHATLFHVLALRTAAKMSPQNSMLQDAFSDMITHMRRHYEKNFDDLAVRLGNLILMVELIEVCFWRIIFDQ
jgi:hypothetical protein